MKNIKDSYELRKYVGDETRRIFTHFGYKRSSVEIPTCSECGQPKFKDKPDFAMKKDGDPILIEIRVAPPKENYLAFDEIDQILGIRKTFPDNKLLLITNKRFPSGLQPFDKDSNIAVIKIGKGDKNLDGIITFFLENGIEEYLQNN